MIVPLPSNEADRLESLGSYQILDTPPEPAFDDIVSLAAQICETPAAIVTLIDAKRRWFKARIGMGPSETHRDHAFCAPETLLGNAEATLKKAKSSGDHYLFFAPRITAKVSEKLALENGLWRALENDEFVLHYQPKLELATGHVSGLEALIRWQHPERGLVPPMQFIPLLEETGLILEAGKWALEQAAADYRAWREQRLEPPRIAVNVSAIQIQQRDFVEHVENAIRLTGMEAALDLEITESAIMENLEDQLDKLLAAKAAGLNIVIDDFGTGYSSLRYLAQLPVSALKIDRSFVAGMTARVHNQLIVSSIITLAHGLNLKVVAEGVDEKGQLELLKQLHCDDAQGYFFQQTAAGIGRGPNAEESACSPALGISRIELSPVNETAFHAAAFSGRVKNGCRRSRTGRHQLQQRLQPDASTEILSKLLI